VLYIYHTLWYNNSVVRYFDFKELTVKRITYKTLMRQIADGRAELASWAVLGHYAHVRFISPSGARTLRLVEVLRAPAGVQP
jgi:hypothetical protein